MLTKREKKHGLRKGIDSLVKLKEMECKTKKPEKLKIIAEKQEKMLDLIDAIIEQL